MGYLHIDNLYKDQRVLLFKEVFAMEKIHGTSAHLHIEKGRVSFHSGGAEHLAFTNLFDVEALLKKTAAAAFAEDAITIYGEACGGKVQKMSHAYGPTLRFVAFEVRINRAWLAVPQAADVAQQLGLDFVDYVRVPAELPALDEQRDRPSSLALRLGLGEQMREGIVIRPPIEVRINNDARIIAKHKREEFAETVSPRRVSVDPNDRVVLEQAQAIADEWVTPMRLNHVADAVASAKGKPALDITDTGDIIRAMLEDVEREAKGEIIPSKAARNAISRAAAHLWKQRVTKVPQEVTA